MWGGMCSGQISTGLITCQNNYLYAKDEGNYNTIGGLSIVHRSRPGYDQCDSELGSYPGQVSTFWHTTTCPPDTKPSKTFTQLKDSPKVFSWLTQLCTMHGYNTYYYSRFNITNRDWDCECRDATPPNPITVREHILHLCPLLADECREFLTPVSSLHETLTLLSSDKGLLATAKFLKESGALTSNCRPY